MYIYTITTVEWPEENDEVVAHTRCVGWTSNFFDAERVIIKNIGDIWEYNYNYAVIEELAEGLYPHPIQEWWFKWDNKIKGYKRVMKPDKLKMFTNFSIG
jgi:hypothetical protein